VEHEFLHATADHSFNPNPPLLSLSLCSHEFATPLQLGVPRGTPDLTTENLAQLASEARVWLPGGIQVTDSGRVAEMLSRDSGRGEFKAAVVAESLGLSEYAAQVADGTEAGADIRIDSSFVIMNTGTRESMVTIEFYADDGSAWEVTIGGVRASQFQYTVATGRTVRVKTEAQGPIKTGWRGADDAAGGNRRDLRHHQSARSSGRRGRSGDLHAGTETAIFAEFDATFDTGVAFLNVDRVAGTDVTLELRDLNGALVDTASRTLAAGAKRAEFVTQLFPALRARSSFRGVIILKSPKPLAVLTLRQRGGISPRCPPCAVITATRPRSTSTSTAWAREACRVSGSTPPSS